MSIAMNCIIYAKYALIYANENFKFMKEKTKNRNKINHFEKIVFSQSMIDNKILKFTNF